MGTTINLKEITGFLESLAPIGLQETYDNSGLAAGPPNLEISAALVTLDITEEVVDEAIKTGCNLIISHHPLIFSGIKKLTGSNYTERTLIKAIKNDIALYSAHTNIDNISNGVNAKICEKLGLKNCTVLKPAEGQLVKLATFVPAEHANKVREALFLAGAGQIGNYSSCSFNSEGLGSFKAGENTHPFAGSRGALHFEKEIRVETIFPQYLQKKVVQSLLSAHPYEEVAYDLYPLKNTFNLAGSGMAGELESPEVEEDFLKKIKKTFHCKVVKHTRLLGKHVKKVAVCGGAGSFLLKDAIAAGAGFFITADFKYHQFFDAENKTVIADIGHYESEQFTKELFSELLLKKFPTFAVRLSEANTNPVNYF